MSLTDVMSGAGLAIYAEIGFVIFGAAFVWICVGIFRRGNREELERARFLPFADEAARRDERTDR